MQVCGQASTVMPNLVCGQASTAMPNLAYVSVLFKEAVCLEERYA